MGEALPDDAKRMLADKVFAVLSTLNADGSPQSSVLWAKSEGDEVVMSTAVGRKKEQNLRRDPRVSVLVTDPGNPYAYVEVRGYATLTEEGGRELIDELSNKYVGQDYAVEPEGTVRVVIRVTASKVITRG